MGWFRNAKGTGVSGVVVLLEISVLKNNSGQKSICKSKNAISKADSGYKGNMMVKTSSDEHQSAEYIAALAHLAS